MAERGIKKTTKEFLEFGYVKTEEINVSDIDIENILVSVEFSYGKNRCKNLRRI